MPAMVNIRVKQNATIDRSRRSSDKPHLKSAALLSSGLRHHQDKTTFARKGQPLPDETIHHLCFSLPDLNSIDISGSLSERIAGQSRRITRDCDVFGLEQKAQFLLEQKTDTMISRKSLYRLSQEVLILSNWIYIKTGRYDLEKLASLGSLLCGRPVKLRSQPMWARGPVGHFVFFENMSQSASLIKDLACIFALDANPVVKAICAYTRVIMAHPLTDGNGRLARAIFYGPLATGGLVHTPCLALGAILECSKEEIARSTTALGETGRWQPHLDVMEDILTRGVELISDI